MKKIAYILGLILIVSLLAACTQVQKVPAAPPSAASTVEEVVSESSPLSDIPTEEEARQQAEAREQAEAPPQSADDLELSNLLAKNKNVDNIYYILDEASNGDKIYLLGDKIRIVYSDTTKVRDNVFYSEIYLDLKKKTAIAVCTKGGIICSPIWNSAFALDFEEEKNILTPMQIAQQVHSGKKMGTEFFQGRSLNIYEFVNSQGLKEQISVDPYFGLPFKQTIFESSKEGDTIKEKHTFTKIEIGQIKEADVTLPANYVIVS